ncbi:hypothetical protein BHE90_009458 [Fusarium euwallaceae]|uniref:Deacetylase sirtuin-type domain-containing protein n=1 Tax=Fusarium euwallaceae TaxID=1147111 RepID=A0A430LK24_9HYPO|nr:hypothetical protein BHE90_009458 [Fusarium euwallaceae]
MPPSTDVEAFHEVLRSSKRILALCGAGLSASSGLPTFRGAGGLWRNYDATTLATPTAFGQDPGLVWMFYGYRRHMALNVKPNPAHYALAALAEKNKDFLCLTQNVDNLSPRANHPPEQLRTLHGSLFDIKCSNGRCDWIQHGNYDDPFFPALAPASEDPEPGMPSPLLDPFHPLEPIPKDQIPKCPKCGKGFQRPGVVWFNEGLDRDMLEGIDNWLDQGKVDLMLVIGTSAKVWPAAGYIDQAREKGARVAVINMEAASDGGKDSDKDFFFGQDAAECLPLLPRGTPLSASGSHRVLSAYEVNSSIWTLLFSSTIYTHQPPPTVIMQGFNMGRYVPPDVEGTTSGNRLHGKRPPSYRAGGQTVRFEMPFPIWCTSCPKPTIIGQGVRFNAAKSRVGSYFSTPIWSFRFRHADCSGEIEMRTDPKNTAYVVVEGGKKRDTGEDEPREGDAVILTDQEREALRKNAFASLEKTIEDREQLKLATERIDDLAEVSSKHWKDPYTQNQRLRKAFRQERKERERTAAATENLQDRMSLGIDIVPATEEDSRRAALVDFGPVDENGRDRALSKPLFKSDKTPAKSSSKLKTEKEASKRKETLVSELLGNTRASTDPFLLNNRSEPKGTSRLPGLKRKRPQEPEAPSKAQAQEATTGLVDYDSD